jgi:hypothetical protein
LVTLQGGTKDVFAVFDPAAREVISISGTATLALADLGNAVVFTGSSAATLNLPAVATAPLGAGWLVMNSGTAALTIDPNGAETVNGTATLVLQPGASAMLVRVASAWQAAAMENATAWVDVASAATVDLSAQASRSLRLTGTTTITSFGTAASGVRKRLRIATGLIITHNATSLICPGAANLVLGGGDIVDVESLGFGNWVVTNIARINIVSNIFNATTIATTSGTEFDFTGIPAWARRITVMLDNVSLSGSDDLLIKNGDAGGIETSNYTSGSASSSNSTAGYVVRLAGPGRAACGMAIIQNLTGNVWVSSHSVNVGSVSDFSGGGRKELSGTLDRFRVTRSGSNTFDGGFVGLSYE